MVLQSSKSVQLLAPSQETSTNTCVITFQSNDLIKHFKKGFLKYLFIFIFKVVLNIYFILLVLHLINMEACQISLTHNQNHTG